MERDTEITKVVFRKFKQGGDILALFPEIPADMNGHCQSYQHIGQHGAADFYHCIHTLTVPAKPAEYADLKAELEGRGYNLQVIQRASYKDHAARIAELKKMQG